MLGMMLRLLNALGVSARWCGAFRRSGIVVEAQAPAARALIRVTSPETGPFNSHTYSACRFRILPVPEVQPRPIRRMARPVILPQALTPTEHSNNTGPEYLKSLGQR